MNFYKHNFILIYNILQLLIMHVILPSEERKNGEKLLKVKKEIKYLVIHTI